MSEVDLILDNLRKTHLIVNSEAGHGKTTFVRNLVKTLKEREPKTIVKVFDISLAWFNRSPLPKRQKITQEMIYELVQNKSFRFGNVNNCVYELGELSDELRQFFIAVIIEQDYRSRYQVAEQYGEETVKKLPRIVYVFEESDIYFGSRFLNSKQDSAKILSEFVKVGRNFGLRGICIVTAAVGELATKLRRRSKHLVGKIISDADLRAYNRMKKGLGNRAMEIEPYHWVYYNGEVTEPFTVPDLVASAPENYVWVQPRVKVEEKSGAFGWVKWLFVLLLVFLAGYCLNAMTQLGSRSAYAF